MNRLSALSALTIAVSPFGRPDARLVAAVCRAGGTGVLDLGTDEQQAARSLDQLVAWTANAPGPFGIRTAAHGPLNPAQVLRLGAGRVELAVVDDAREAGRWAGTVRTLVEVTSLDQARAAAAAGAHGLIARGQEAGGAVGELSTFVLLQQLLDDPRLALPVWAAGGIGVHTAPAAVIAGASGVVLDTALALLDECELPAELTAALRRLDGTESTVTGGHRGVIGRDGTPNLPVGQDAFLAKRFRDTYRTAGATVRALRAAVLAATEPDAPAHPVDLGCPLPVVQGPMTRVSDQPAFARSVAEAGGLPFLALALSTPEQTRAMLEQTRTLLGDRPWGVGVLGFAPEELRAAQLQVIRDVRPTHAIIAGGRPAQAFELEAAGISTFLHVPSPGLLTQFLAAGARKFIFEGSECGGHVGPRAGFPLWEAQLGALSDHLDEHGSTDVQVLFAGGFRDSRSAAVASVLAGPLVHRGLATGVLMGTAYLFTAEAVADGAILPTFQHELIAAEATALLESAPGHATRVIATRYASDFALAKADFAASGLEQREVWERLEQLNLGRLRIASKGLRRDGERLVAVDEQIQRVDGLFMAGQVAVLENTVTTIAALHADVTSGAAEYRAARAAELRAALAAPEEPAAAAAPLDIAIVGMECLFPGSPELAAFWATILDGVDAVTEVPPSRWDANAYYDEAATGRSAGEKTPSRWGGFLPPIAFDPLRYGIPPAALPSIDPSQLLALEVARRALVDAGYDRPGVDHSTTSVIFGAEGGSDLSNAGVLRTVLPAYVGELPAELDEQLPRLTEDSFPGVLGNVIAGRIANRLDLGGANFTVDAACASGLAAVDLACRQLRDHSSDLALCGAVDLHNGVHDFLMFSSVHALSPTGHSRTFDTTADGIALGEGVACLVLKRLADAERDGDRIYGVIAGVGSASDGRALGLTAPRPEGQRRALDRAYAAAGVSPRQVGLVEAHGTGTVVGDRTELAVLTELFTDAGAAAGGCALGSVKSQIGHTKCAAGLAGLIKATMAIHTGVRPPTIGLSDPNPEWDAASSPFAFHTAARPWPVPVGERIAGVSAFGFGGTNFHLVLRGHDGGPAPRHGRAEWPAELFLFAGANVDAARRDVTWLRELAAAHDAAGRPWRLRDLAATAAARTEDRRAPVRIAIVARDLDELAALLERAAAGEHDPAHGLHQPAENVETGELALLFPGQGSQRTGMLAELFVAFPELHDHLRLDPDTTAVTFPPTAFGDAAKIAQDDALRDTRRAQPALGLAGLAAAHVLRRLGLRPDLVAGHSYGELVALAAAGAFDAATLLELSAARAQTILAAAGEDPGTMAAISASAAEITAVLREAGLDGRVVPANQNAPRQTVISGPTEDVARALDALRTAGLAGKRIPVACAFHSPVVAAAGEAFGAVLDAHELRAPRLPVWTNRTAAPYGDVRTELVAQLGSPVRFTDEIEAMYAAGTRVFVEAGPGQVLTRLVDAILGDRPHLAVAIEPRPGAGLRGLLDALAALAVAGVPWSASALFAGRDARDVAALPLPKRAGWTVDGHLVRTADGRPLAGGLAPAQRITTFGTAATGGPAMTDPSVPTAQALLAEYLRSSRELIAAQRDVMLGFLAANSAASGGGAAGVVGWQPVLQATPVTVTEPVAASIGAPATVIDAEPAAVEPSAGLDTEQVVLTIIAERTGYPLDMIEPDLDLEADLSIDSIKRTEIAGELALRLGLGTAALGDAELEELAKARTARAIVAWLAERVGQPGTSDPATAAGAGSSVDGAAGGVVAGVPPVRLLAREIELPAAGAAADLAGTQVAVLGAPATHVTAITHGLTTAGAVVSTTAADTTDAVVWLTGWPGGGEALDTAPTDTAPMDTAPMDTALFDIAAFAGELAQVLRHAPRRLLIAAPRTAGLRGLVRSVAREYPDVRLRLLELPAAGSADEVAAAVVDELGRDEDVPLVLREGPARRTVEVAEAPLGVLATTGAGPAGDGASEAQALGLDQNSVVVLVGGARGITAQVALGLAAASHCQLELLGSTELSSTPEPAELAAATTAAELRTALVAGGLRAPAEVERQVGQLLARREIAATLRRAGELGSDARYTSVDVRDAEAVHHALKRIHAEHGRVDGVVYAAGVIEDKLLADKDPDSFRRVYATKVDGAGAVLAALDDLPTHPRFVVLFGSIAAVFGNRGQADYAAANDALALLGARWSAVTGGRCLTVHWGPWAPSPEHAGMVTTELAAAYAKRGISLIAPDEGPLSLLRELAWGDPALTEVVYAASGW